MKPTELQLITKMYEAYNKSNPRKKNLLNTSKSIYYLDWYNIKEEYSWDFALTVNWFNREVMLISINKSTFKEPTISKEFPLSTLWKEWFFDIKEARAYRNKLFTNKELR